MENHSSVLSWEYQGVGWISLNRPRFLNSLSHEMIQIIEKQLHKWKDDDGVALICLFGEGEKGLCAGGDIRWLSSLRESNLEETALPFFVSEYRTDLAIHRYPKPILAYMDGIVMGGGVGLSIGAKYRIVTERTRWAMPEANIGFFPDVGSSYFLNKMPGFIGRYLALTAETIHAADVLYVGAATHYLESENWDLLQKKIQESNWSVESSAIQLNMLLNEFASPLILETHSPLAQFQDQIDTHFHFDTIEEILSSLENASVKGDLWAIKAEATMRSKSPTSLKVILRQLQEGKGKSLPNCFGMELALSMNFLRSHDFYEGVRAILVDKDRNPKWNPSELQNIDEEYVQGFFHYSRLNDMNEATENSHTVGLN